MPVSDAKCQRLLRAGTRRRLRGRGAGSAACCAQAGSSGAAEDGAGKNGPQPAARGAAATGPRSLWARGLRVGMPQDGDGKQGEHDGKFVIDRDGNRIEVMFHDYGETGCLIRAVFTDSPIAAAAAAAAESRDAHGLASIGPFHSL